MIKTINNSMLPFLLLLAVGCRNQTSPTIAGVHWEKDWNHGDTIYTMVCDKTTMVLGKVVTTGMGHAVSASAGPYFLGEFTNEAEAVHEVTQEVYYHRDKLKCESENK